MTQTGQDLQRETLSEEHRIFRLVLTKEETPLDSPYPATRLARAMNPATPRRILQILATQEGHRIVRAAALNALTPLSLWPS
jgi:hypothetical protein